MFELFRNGVGSLFAGILLTLLILSFAIWGIGDPLNTLGSADVAEVGGEKVTPDELARSFENEFQMIQQNAGEGLTRELAVQFGLGAQAAAKLVERKAYDVEARNLGLRTPDAELRDYIYSIPVFQDETGSFNRSYFDQFVAAQRYSTKEFEQLLRGDLIRNQMIEVLMNNINSPEITAETLTKFASEQRISEVLSVPASQMTAIGEETDDVLRAYYEENPDGYMSPEYRDVSYFEISANDLTGKIEVSEDEARASYDERIDEYTDAEERGFIQMLLDDQETADIAYTELQNGKSFEDVILEKTGSSAEESIFDAETRETFASTYGEDAADLLFDLDENGYTAPVESGFGVYIFKVTSIKAGSVQSFEDARDGIIQDIKTNRAIDQLFDVRNTIDDELAAGSPIDVIAQAIEVPLKTISNVSIEGMMPDGRASTELPLIVDFLDQAFTRDIGVELELLEGISNKFYMLNIDNITDAQLRDFEDVKADVSADWAQNRREELASEIANKVIEDINASEDADKTLASFQNIVGSNLTLNDVTVGRSNEDNAVSAEIHSSIFSQEIGGVEMIPAANGDGYVLVHVKERQFKDDVEDEAIASTKDQIKTSYQNDFMGAFIVHLYGSLPVTMNNANIKATLDQIVVPAE